MSTIERDEFINHLNRCSVIVAGWPDWKAGILDDRGPVVHEAKPSEVDDLKAKLAEVTRERDELDAANKSLSRLNVNAVDYTEKVEKKLAQAREQLAAVQAEAAAMRPHVEALRNDLLQEVDPEYGHTEAQRSIISQLNEINACLNGTAGRELADEMRRKDDEIRSLKSRQQYLVEAGARYKRKARTAKAALIEARERIEELEAELTERETDEILADPEMMEAIKQGEADIAAGRVHDLKAVKAELLKDQPTPEPVYWRFKTVSPAQAAGFADYRCLDGEHIEFCSDESLTWKGAAITKGELEVGSHYERCNADGTPLVKPEPVWQYRAHKMGASWRTDDDEALDRDFIQQMHDTRTGSVSQDGDNYYFGPIDHGVWPVCCKMAIVQFPSQVIEGERVVAGRWEVFAFGHNVAVSTRREFRQLCEAIGIETKKGGDA